MKSNEEFIAGIYQKAEEARKKETSIKEISIKETSMKETFRLKTFMDIKSVFCHDKRRYLTVLAALAGVVLLCGLFSLERVSIWKEKEPENPNIEAAQENYQEGDEAGIALAQHEPQAFAEEPSISKARTTIKEEVSIQAKLLRSEETEEDTVVYYEALEVVQTVQAAPEEEEPEETEREACKEREELADLPEEGMEFSLSLTEEEVTQFYPFGLVPGSIQVLFVCQGEQGLVLSRIEQKEESEE